MSSVKLEKNTKMWSSDIVIVSENRKLYKKKMKVKRGKEEKKKVKENIYTCKINFICIVRY